MCSKITIIMQACTITLGTDKSSAETECCACEPGGLASAFRRTSGFSLATTRDQFSTAAASRVVQTGRHPVSSLVHSKL